MSELAGKIILSVWGFSLIASWGFSSPAAAVSKMEMMERYNLYASRETGDSLPFALDSYRDGKIYGAGVTTFLPGIPFSLFSERLSVLSEWCEFIPLHLNVKACTFETVNGKSKLGFYIGVKTYMTPDEAELLLLDYDSEVTDDVLLIGFAAAAGPFGSSNYDFQIRAVGVDGGVYLEFDLSSEPGMVSALARLYLFTAGRGKIGFSKKKTRTGRIKHIGGARAGSERNIVRYLLSIQAYFDTLEAESAEDGYRRRLERWFDLTQMHKKQLYELSRQDYIDIKLRERKNQITLMSAGASKKKPADQTGHPDP